MRGPQEKLIVILNDNEMSISRNVGALSSYLTELRTDPAYSRVKADVEGVLKAIPSIGTHVAKTVGRLKDSPEVLLCARDVFEDLGFKYLGPVNGHDIPSLVETLQKPRI